MKTLTLAFALSALITVSAVAAFSIPEPPLIGPACVIDGDTIVINGTHIRLSGIDAPETNQVCFDANNLPWRCGEVATQKLRELIGTSEVSCVPKEKDRYGRTVAECGDLNEKMVFLGYALAYRQYGGDRYAITESRAQAAKVGIWQGTFTYPWVWRREHHKNSTAGTFTR